MRKSPYDLAMAKSPIDAAVARSQGYEVTKDGTLTRTATYKNGSRVSFP